MASSRMAVRYAEEWGTKVAKQYSPKLKFQVVLEVLSVDKTVAQVAKAYDVHPNSVNNLDLSPFLPSPSSMFGSVFGG